MNERTFWVLLRIEVPLIEGWQGEHPDSPIGYMPVFESEAAARAHAGGHYQVIAVRAATPPQAAAGGSQDEG